MCGGSGLSSSPVDFDEVARVQRQCAVLETRRDVWITAAVMTALLAPAGTVFGLSALVVTLGSRAALDRQDMETASSKLHWCRVLVLVGTALGIGLLVWQGSSVLAVLLSPAGQMQRGEP